MEMKRVIGVAAAALACLLFGAAGMGCVYAAKLAYDDHALLNQIRRSNEQQLINAAEQVKQFQQQQQGQAPGAAPAK